MDGQVGNLSQRVLEKLVVIFKVKIKKKNKPTWESDKPNHSHLLNMALDKLLHLNLVITGTNHMIYGEN